MASQLLWSGSEPVMWESVNWNSVNWNSATVTEIDAYLVAAAAGEPMEWEVPVWQAPTTPDPSIKMFLPSVSN